MADLRRTGIHNAAITVVGALLFFAVWAAVERFSTPTGQPTWAAVASSPFVHTLFGVAVYFAFRGHPLARVALVTTIPLISSLVFEVLIGSDAAYPYMALLFGGVAAVAFLIGAAVAAGLSWAVNRKHANQAT